MTTRTGVGLMDQSLRDLYRNFLKDTIRKTIDFRLTDQNRGIAPPPIEQPYPVDATRIDLVPYGKWTDIRAIELTTALFNRKSRRLYRNEPLSLDELSFLLWATQGIRAHINSGHAYRTVPSAGCRHALETYLCVVNIHGLQRGVYRYLPVEHQLLLERVAEDIGEKVVAAVFGQPYPGKAAVTFVWVAIPYRMEWRYDIAAYKVIALDAGHVAQNLYLACESMGAGTCAIAAYDQEAMDTLLGVDGTDEFAIYCASVGKARD